MQVTPLRCSCGSTMISAQVPVSQMWMAGLLHFSTLAAISPSLDTLTQDNSLLCLLLGGTIEAAHSHELMRWLV